MGGEVQLIGLLVVCMGQTSKPVDMLIIPAVATNNQHAPDPMGSVNKLNLSGDVLELGLESDQVCYKVYPSIAPMALVVFGVSGDSASQGPKES